MTLVTAEASEAHIPINMNIILISFLDGDLKWKRNRGKMSSDKNNKAMILDSAVRYQMSETKLILDLFKSVFFIFLQQSHDQTQSFYNFVGGQFFT